MCELSKKEAFRNGFQESQNWKSYRDLGDLLPKSFTQDGLSSDTCNLIKIIQDACDWTRVTRQHSTLVYHPSSCHLEGNSHSSERQVLVFLRSFRNLQKEEPFHIGVVFSLPLPIIGIKEKHMDVTKLKL